MSPNQWEAFVYMVKSGALHIPTYKTGPGKESYMLELIILGVGQLSFQPYAFEAEGIPPPLDEDPGVLPVDHLLVHREP